MAQPKTNLIVNVILGISFLIAAVSGIVLLSLPSGFFSGYSTFAGITKSSWVSIHRFMGILLIISAAIHLILHRDWFAAMTRSAFNKRGEKYGKK